MIRHSLRVRDSVPTDHAAISRVATAAWHHYSTAFTSWAGLAALVANVSALVSECELIIAQQATEVVGSADYVAPRRPREPIFSD